MSKEELRRHADLMKNYVIKEVAKIKEKSIGDDYENNECPDCGQAIPADAEEGHECSNCGHGFHHFKPVDDSVEKDEKPLTEFESKEEMERIEAEVEQELLAVFAKSKELKNSGKECHLEMRDHIAQALRCLK